MNPRRDQMWGLLGARTPEEVRKVNQGGNIVVHNRGSPDAALPQISPNMLVVTQREPTPQHCRRPPPPRPVVRGDDDGGSPMTRYRQQQLDRSPRDSPRHGNAAAAKAAKALQQEAEAVRASLAAGPPGEVGLREDPAGSPPWAAGRRSPEVLMIQKVIRRLPLVRMSFFRCFNDWLGVCVF